MKRGNSEKSGTPLFIDHFEYRLVKALVVQLFLTCLNRCFGRFNQLFIPVVLLELQCFPKVVQCFLLFFLVKQILALVLVDKIFKFTVVGVIFSCFEQFSEHSIGCVKVIVPLVCIGQPHLIGEDALFSA